MEITLGNLAALIGGDVHGDAEIIVGDLKPLDKAGPGDLTFVTNKKYLAAAVETKASAVLCEEGLQPEGCDCVIVKNAYLALARIQQQVHTRARADFGVHEKALVDESADIGPGSNIYPGAVIGRNAVIGADTDIMPGCVIGEAAQIGSESLLYPNVTVYHKCRVGDRAIIHSGTVVGSDGYGFATDHETGCHEKIPQVGIVVIEDDVEVGSNCSIDRAAMGETRIGRGTKIDNLVQVAHNVQIGEDCFVVGQAGISGSSKVGNRAILAGQVGVVGHIEIGEGAIVGAQSGVTHDIENGETVMGSPARPMAQTKRIMAAESRLPAMVKEIRALRKELNELKARLPQT